MDGRTSGLLVAALLVGCGGCVTMRDDKTVTPSATAPAGERVTRAEGSKKATPAVAIEFARMRRTQADAAKSDPEAQSRLRDEARTAYQEALKVDPNNVDALRGLAQVYVQQNDFDRAFEAYRKAQAKHPKNAGLWLEVAMVHNRRKEWTEAQTCCRKALELDPENRQAQSLLGMTLARAGEYDKALPHLTKASGAAVAHYNVARMQLHMGQKEQARQHLSIAVRENPSLTSAHDLLAHLDTGGSNVVQTRGVLQPPTP